MKKKKVKRELFDPNNIPVKGSLGILALGDIGFEAWRKVKKFELIDDRDEKE